MILESFEHAEADIEARLVIEASNEARQVLEACAKSTQSEEYRSLPGEEKASIASAAGNLEEALKSEDSQKIRDAIEKLNDATMDLARLIMDGVVARALKDKRVKEVQ
jgi:molecular chaperone DnaK (HSP70)